jgi:hypothetical protein
MASLFERLTQGRPAQEPAPTQKPPWPESAQKLLDWLHRSWTKPILCDRDIRIYGPRSIRDRKRARETAEILVEHKWLFPLKTHRYDRRAWRVGIFEKEMK